MPSRRWLRTRRRLARWLDPDPPQASQPEPPAPPQGEPVAGPAPGGSQEPFWPEVGQQFAMRLLASAYRLSSYLGEAETAERDPDQLQRLFHVDHAITQIRRQAENLHVLTGLRIDDAGRQITTLLDVIRAAASAVEQFRRVQIGHVVELAVAEHAADDVIRVLTELVDNATQFSPPGCPVTVSAHLTEHGTVLLRIEDSGVGVPPTRLPYLNAMLAGDLASGGEPGTAGQLGLVVVRRLAEVNGLRVHLTPRQPDGTTAIVLLPSPVLCEVPAAARHLPPGGTAAPYAPPGAGAQRQRVAAVAAVRPRSGAAPRHLAGPHAGVAARRQRGPAPAPDHGDSRLPRRVPESLRGEAPAAAPAAPANPPADTRFADEIGAFADGLADAEHSRAATPTEGTR